MTDAGRPERPVGAPDNTSTDLDFRRALAADREIKGAIHALRGDIDGEIARFGSCARVRTRILARLRRDPYAGLDWRKIAAAFLVAGMLGGAIDVLLFRPESEPADIVMVDPVLYGLDFAELR